MHEQAQVKQDLLDLMAEGNLMTEACQQIGVSRRTILRWRHDDPEFKEAFDDAHQMMAIALNDDGMLLLKQLAHGQRPATKETIAAAVAYSQRCAWNASKLVRKLYGDEAATKQVNNFNAPVQALVVTEEQRMELIEVRNEALRLANKTETTTEGKPNEVLQPNHPLTEGDGDESEEA